MRLASVDFIRTIAIACMIAAHTSVASNGVNKDLSILLSVPLRVGIYPSQFAAPLFLIVAGIGYEFLIRSRKDIYELTGRSIILFLLPVTIWCNYGQYFVEKWYLNRYACVFI